MKSNYFFLLFVAFILISCETDFEVNAPWKETAVVYGLLDQSVDTQRVVIYKTFLGQQSAYDMAQEADSFYYAENELDVFLYALNQDGDTLQSIPMQYQLTDSRKTMGFDTIFSTDYSVEYITVETLDESLTYHLHIHNTESGYEARAKTNLIEPLDINPGFTDEIKFYKNNDYRRHKLSWSSSKHGKIYMPFMRFYYFEKDLSSGQVNRFHIDKQYPQMYSPNTSGGTDMELYISGESFYFFITNSISRTPSSKNKCKELEMVFQNTIIGLVELTLFLVGGKDIAQYIEINNLPTVLFQDPPFYQHRERARCFSSRLHAQQTGKSLDVASLIFLANGELTDQLNFIEP